jgi:hypothetical protein
LLVLRGGGLATMKQGRTGPTALEHLRPVVDAEEQPTWPARTGPELSVDVLDVPVGNHHDVEARSTQTLDEVTQAARVGGTVRHQGAVPVGNARFKTPVESRDRCGCQRAGPFTSLLVGPQDPGLTDGLV